MLFIRGIRKVFICTKGILHNIHVESYIPKLTNNVLSFDQLILQGYEVKFERNKCHMRGMFNYQFNPNRDATSWRMKTLRERENIVLILIYMKYLDVLEWFYKVMKKGKTLYTEDEDIERKDRIIRCK